MQAIVFYVFVMSMIVVYNVHVQSLGTTCTTQSVNNTPCQQQSLLTCNIVNNTLYSGSCAHATCYNPIVSTCVASVGDTYGTSMNLCPVNNFMCASMCYNPQQYTCVANTTQYTNYYLIPQLCALTSSTGPVVIAVNNNNTADSNNGSNVGVSTNGNDGGCSNEAETRAGTSAANPTSAVSGKDISHHSAAASSMTQLIKWKYIVAIGALYAIM